MWKSGGNPASRLKKWKKSPVKRFGEGCGKINTLKKFYTGTWKRSGGMWKNIGKPREFSALNVLDQILDHRLEMGVGLHVFLDLLKPV